MILDHKGNKYYKLGLHIHTTRSDGHRTPEEAARIYREAGYDAIALTDHWIYGREDEIEGVKILSGLTDANITEIEALASEISREI